MKFFKKKLLLGLAPVVGILPIATVSCGASDIQVTNIKVDNDLKLSANEKLAVKKIALILDEGTVNDKSFNQSSWEALQKFATENELQYDKKGFANNAAVGYYAIANKNYLDQYDAAINQGYSVLLLNGFTHEEYLKKWLENQTNIDKLKARKIVFIALDFTLSDKVLDEVTQKGANGFFISLQYKSNEGGFIAGLAASDMFKDEADAQNRTFTTFGGSDINAVTDFNEGFYKGVYFGNLIRENANNRLKSVNDGDSVLLDTNFDAAKTDKQTKVQGVIKKNTKLILPVAGSWTQYVTKNMKSSQYVIGVDGDQGIADTGKTGQYFTSITKNIGQSVFEVISVLQKTNEELLNKYVGEFRLGTKNVRLTKGFDADWSGVAPTHLSNETLAKKAQTALDNATKAFRQLKNNLALRKFIEVGYTTLNGDGTENDTKIDDNAKRINALSDLLENPESIQYSQYWKNIYDNALNGTPVNAAPTNSEKPSN
ncbi:BMP family ABC transporter substrate-binding protein [Mycoplasmopsis columbinasalis]|uniref:Basic membrane protein n=1 Tax=Mycoplasmopsis columbinasalis TaxID=114880 RepID=A0A449BA25_9BACT|nr:BMP family ABC transporter substrate-binding protein [Mycoplasmopsis columbinasalis]VEU78017.1 Basic membrane protein [Mycoplasmopsis columbinasalis]